MWRHTVYMKTDSQCMPARMYTRPQGCAGDTEEGALVRKLSTHGSRVLFDANMERYIEYTGNDSIVRTLVLTVSLVALCLGYAFLAWRRHLKAPVDVHSAT